MSIAASPCRPKGRFSMFDSEKLNFYHSPKLNQSHTNSN